MSNIDIIKKPILTEKSLDLASKGFFVFKVAKKATKGQVKDVLEDLFKVKVKKVNLINVPGKPKRWGKKQGYTASFRKAVVTLIKGKIDLFNLK
ncbi:MAG: 50S ribosomal protein L23 [Patescibacteria group bacterium]|nr:50S ribosomal protein L23 [Patescibacteria group bacterium]